MAEITYDRADNRDSISEKKILFSAEKAFSVKFFFKIDSTNSEARRQAELPNNSFPMLIAALSQSAGRGRLGRSFYSPSDTGLYMSFVAEAPSSAADSVRLTTAAAVAVAQAIEEVCGISVGIKWVNDIYVCGRKVCGILCESFSTARGKRFVVVGVGINLCTESFPDEIAAIAGSIGAEIGSREMIASKIADRLCDAWNSSESDELMEYYRAHSVVLGERVEILEGDRTFFGVAESINEFGWLSVRLDGGELKVLSSGEITLRVKSR